MSTPSTRIANTKRPATAKTVASIVSSASLVLSTSFWLALAFSFVPGVPRINLTGFQWFKIMAVAVLLAGVGGTLRSRLWRVAVPLALMTFFFVMYVMGT